MLATMQKQNTPKQSTIRESQYTGKHLLLYIYCKTKSLVTGAGMYWMRKKRQLANMKRETVEKNPDYGNNYLDDYSRAVDQNDYYDVETEY